ncbi:hypothetical protein ES707_14259 [subsurface metagenome]
MKSKLTPELQDKIIKYIKAGNYNKVACQMVGIWEKTYYRWIKRGEKALELEEEGKEISESEKIYCQFCQSIRQAEAEAEIRNVTVIYVAAKEDWHAAMEILARKYHDRWGRKELVGGIKDKPILHEVKIVDVYGRNKKNRST